MAGWSDLKLIYIYIYIYICIYISVCFCFPFDYHLPLFKLNVTSRNLTVFEVDITSKFRPCYKNSFQLAKERSRRYSTQIITEVDYAVDITLQANTAAQVETLLHSLERAAAGIGFHVNADKTEYMCDISILNGSSLKLLDRFTYLGSSVSSTESDINTRLSKAWAAPDRLSVI